MKSKPKDKKLTRNKARDTGRSSARRAQRRSRERVQTPEVWSVTALKEEATGRLRNEVTFPVGDGTTGMRKFGAEVPAEVIVRQLRKYSNAITNDAAGRVRQASPLGEQSARYPHPYPGLEVRSAHGAAHRLCDTGRHSRPKGPPLPLGPRL